MSLVNLLALSITEIIGDFGFRAFAEKGIQQGFFQGIAGYIGVIYFLIKSLKTSNVLFVNGMWDGLSGVLESLAAFFILGDRLNGPLQYLGLVMTTVGLVFLKMN